MDPAEAARAWVRAWRTGWLAHDPDVIAARYAEGCDFRSHPFRDALVGRDGARTYVTGAFAEERSADPTFADPIVMQDGRAAVEYRARIVTTTGARVTLAGVTVLRFDRGGMVTEHRDYWATEES
jgi:nuclear transport factor 2 (NTF2) superfamily protein